ncbi:MAG: winged helix-turn-helix transcriptional regulator [Tissierella sp.]|nr:winged helix-turn-helix transcriptional regulator [Tissierella sp.]
MLTIREKEVLEAIIDYIEANEYVPSVREICEVVGLKSTSTAHGHLKSLESKGYIERKEKFPRVIKVLKKVGE